MMKCGAEQTQTEMFTEDCCRIPTEKKELLKGCEKADLLMQVEACYSQAAGLARHYKRLYMRLLKILSLFSVLLVMTYLIYDEGNITGMLIGYMAALLFYYIVFKYVDKSRVHEKYISYRLLAETLRVQTFLLAIGIHENIARKFTWTQKQETKWIADMIDSFLSANGSCYIPQGLIREAWITEQLSYHRSAYIREKEKHDRAESISRAMIICTLLLFAAVLVLEFLMPTYLEHSWKNLSFSAWLKILWGSFSAITLFSTTYYGQQSLERKMTDHEKMAGLFEEAERRYKEQPDARMELFRELAREEIIESGNWMSYCHENRPTFSI